MAFERIVVGCTEASKAIGKKVFPALPIGIKRQIIYFRLNGRLIPRKPTTFLIRFNGGSFLIDGN